MPELFAVWHGIAAPVPAPGRIRLLQSWARPGTDSCFLF
jgi:hypothetical protein